MKLGNISRAALWVAASFAAATALAQTTGNAGQRPLNLPQDPQFLAQPDPSVRKATAIVNGEIITETDIDHRVGLIIAANGGRIPAEELPRLREQVLRNLIDETLQIQAAASKDIKIEQREIETVFNRLAQDNKRTPEQFAEYLRSLGSSPAAFKRQIHAEMAWARLQSQQIEPFVTVSEEEVRTIVERLTAARGTREYRVYEIFLPATPENDAQARANAQRILAQLRQGGSFIAYARQFSEASTRGVGGDLGWVRPEQMRRPELGEVVSRLQVGQVSDPIRVPEGYWILAVQDTRQLLTADPRDAVLSLMQLSITFPPGTTRAQAQPKIDQLTRISQTMGGCGRAQEAAVAVGAELVSSDQVRARDLPPALQNTMLRMGIGQATPPFGTLEEGVRVLVLCGRDEPNAAAEPSTDAIYASLKEDRVNRRARRYLRDLRRDAVVDYR